MIHYLIREQIVPAPRQKVWDYFCDPQNLDVITPPDMNFEILQGADSKMYPGQLIEYRVEFVRGIRSRWLTEIAHVRAGEYFVFHEISPGLFRQMFQVADSEIPYLACSR